MTIEETIKYAADKRLHLEPKDFELIDGQPAIDGMDPKEWVDAMTSD